MAAAVITLTASLAWLADVYLVAIEHRSPTLILIDAGLAVFFGVSATVWTYQYLVAKKACQTTAQKSKKEVKSTKSLKA